MNNGIGYINNLKQKSEIVNSYKDNGFEIAFLDGLKVLTFESFYDALKEKIGLESIFCDLLRTISEIRNYLVDERKLLIVVDYPDSFLSGEKNEDKISFNYHLNEIRYETGRLNLVSLFNFELYEHIDDAIMSYDEYKNNIISKIEDFTNFKILDFSIDEISTSSAFFESFRAQLGLDLPNNRDGFNDVIGDNFYFILTPLILVINDSHNLFIEEKRPLDIKKILESILNDLPGTSYPTYLVYN